MEADQTMPPPLPQPDSPKPGGSGVKKAAGPLVAFAALLKFIPALFGTGATMLLSVAAYATMWSWGFALGLVLLILVHECGHWVVAKSLRLNVGTPVFVPFIGAYVALKNAPHNAWIEALVGIGGPLLGTAGAAACYGIFQVTGQPIFSGLAYMGFMLNLFNLMPVAILDGAKIATALSPEFCLAGVIMIGVTMFLQFNVIALMIFLCLLPRLISLFRKRPVEESRYYEATPSQRWTVAGMYFGLIALLDLGMMISHVDINK